MAQGHSKKREPLRKGARRWEEVKNENGTFLVNEAANMEAAFTSGWYVYTTKSKHTLDAPEYEDQAIGSRCVVKFSRTFNTNMPSIMVRFIKVESPVHPPDEPNVTSTNEYSRIYHVRRYLWFFDDLEDEQLIRKYYEGYSLGGKPIKRKMVAY